jgi:hypothetical protein
MQQFASKPRKKNIMIDFIKNVILFYENKFISDYSLTVDWKQYKNIGNSLKVSGYEVNKCFAFLYSMHNLNFEIRSEKTDSSGVTYEIIKRPSDKLANYGIITFNYDTILERLEAGIKHALSLENEFILNRQRIDDNSIRYCKLHGSLDKNNIIPPTWAKTNIPQIRNDWIDAFQLLKSANDIRIIGFSFPDTDNHISYLFKSALIANENLKSIDVICLDQNDIIKERYKNIFMTDKFRFLNKSVEDLFGHIIERSQSNGKNFDHLDLETAHAQLFRNSV